MVLTGMKLPVPTLIRRYGRELCSVCTPPRSNPSIWSNKSSRKRESIAISPAADIWKWPASKRISMLTPPLPRESKREFNHELRIVPKERIAI